MKTLGDVHRVPWTRKTSGQHTFNPLTWTTDTEQRLQKAVINHRLACSTLNKLYIDMETLRDGPKGPLDQKDFRPTHIYYKSTDLDYKTLSKDYKKRS